MQSITLTKATPADFRKVKQLAYETFYDAFAAQNSSENMQAYTDSALTEKKILLELEEPFSTYYFVTFEEETVGYFKIRTFEEEERKSGMKLERIYVLAPYQGQKIGQQMLDAVIDFAKKENLEYLWLGVWDRNVRAIKFYERNGFLMDGTIDFWMGEELQRDLIMKLDLRR